MDVERIIDDIEQLQEMFEAPDIRPLTARDISVANRRHNQMLAHSPWFRLWRRYGVAAESSRQESDWAKSRAKPRHVDPDAAPYRVCDLQLRFSSFRTMLRSLCLPDKRGVR